ncbi:MAG: hypothetical protein GTO51_00900, partial [Candidatus Latescibacteria bacterium]|nr:hypothetical protein [Candidatus Latescibacterota bacterium]NIM21281.1 hypothetical protein [Candidatus Latescibacterota bacterium]NIM64539.1 hypothetical protein [Candidatus Latescibacterota bacterium]NIO00696.1 hypothetical protein [Candidatus Latescibacterota bacterium]NIO27095.1 hypothetical protein [Candidatus Latescibacterota bacterium]
PNQPSEPKPDVSGLANGTGAALYGPDNPYAIASLDECLGRREVEKVLVALEYQGYMLEPKQSFLVEGADGEEKGSIWFLAMRSVDNASSDAAVVACIRVGGDFSVAPATITTRAPLNQAGFEPISEGVWMKPVQASEIENTFLESCPNDPFPLKGDEGPQLRPSEGFWGAFLECLVSKVPGDVIGCVVSCRILPFGMFTCIIACATGVALANVINCLFIAYRYGGSEKKVE